MKSAYLIRKGEYFCPMFSEDADVLKYVKDEQVIEVQFGRPRNVKNHRRFFKMLDVVISNLPDNIADAYRNSDYLRTELMIGIGHCEWRTSKGGTLYPVAKSMAFDAMDEHKFNQIYNLSVDYLLKHFLKGLDKQALFEMIDSHINLFT